MDDIYACAGGEFGEEPMLPANSRWGVFCRPS